MVTAFVKRCAITAASTTPLKFAIPLFFLFLISFSFVGFAEASKHANHRRYCVVGAGPGGLQAAYYLKRYGMDYIVLERATMAGAFFVKYPRHRKLISVNKARTGRKDAEFNLRFDWNSLIANDIAGTASIAVDTSRASPLFPSYSKEFYPPADQLVAYLGDFARVHELNVEYNADVVEVRRDSMDGDFVVRVGGSGAVHRCFALIVATGKFVPIKLPVEARQPGIIEGYEDFDVDPEKFNNLDVLLFGTGNSALETAESIVANAASTHFVSRRPIRFAHQTHYVGHARSTNLDILDRYQLKVNDAVLFGLRLGDVDLRRNPVPRIGDINENRTKTLIVPRARANPAALARPLRHGYDRIIRALGFRWDSTPFSSSTSSRSSWCDSSQPPSASSCGAVPAKPYEEPGLAFPEVASNFESVNVPRLFTAGTLMHYRDYKRSAGGFIHGFRYLARTLVNQMRERFEKVAYPSLSYGPFATSEEMVNQLVEYFTQRLSNTSSLYQMQGQLCDVMVLERRGKSGRHLRILQDIPKDQVTSRNVREVAPKAIHRAKFVITLMLGFGVYSQGPTVMRHGLEKETLSRVGEKMLWDDASDPDLRLGRAFSATRTVARPNDVFDDYEDSSREVEQHGEAGRKRRQDERRRIEQQWAEPLQPDPARPYDLQPGYQFVHPKLTMYEMPPDEGSAFGTAAKELASMEVKEDVLNEWWEDAAEMTQLRAFFEECCRAR